MKSKLVGVFVRHGLYLIALFAGVGCSASTSTERNGDRDSDSEKLGKVEKEEERSDGKEFVDTIEWVVSDTTEKVKNAGRIDSEWSVNSLSLDIYEKEIPDTSEHASFRFHVRNSSDSLAVIDRVEPSCGCIMATVQKSFAGQGSEGEIYVGLVVSRMSDIQPYTLDVYTTLNPTTPLRLTLRKVAVAGGAGK